MLIMIIIHFLIWESGAVRVHPSTSQSIYLPIHLPPPHPLLGHKRSKSDNMKCKALKLNSNEC